MVILTAQIVLTNPWNFTPLFISSIDTISTFLSVSTCFFAVIPIVTFTRLLCLVFMTFQFSGVAVSSSPPSVSEPAIGFSPCSYIAACKPDKNKATFITADIETICINERHVPYAMGYVFMGSNDPVTYCTESILIAVHLMHTALVSG